MNKLREYLLFFVLGLIPAGGAAGVFVYHSVGGAVLGLIWGVGALLAFWVLGTLCSIVGSIRRGEGIYGHQVAPILKVGLAAAVFGYLFYPLLREKLVG